MQHLCRRWNGRTLLYAWFEAMHTRIDLMLWDADGHDTLQRLLEAANRSEAETLRIEEMGSRFRPQSEVARINSAAEGCRIAVSGELCGILLRCKEYTRQTDGLFDVTAREGFAARPGDERFVVETPFVARTDSRVRIDLSGYLKGYALDRTVEILEQLGIGNALLNFGNSSIFGRGRHPHGEAWNVAYGDGTQGSYTLHDECLTTSGNNTDARCHIVHPLTGRPVRGKRKVSVVTRSGEEGEAWSIARFLAEAAVDV